ncbi:hypothetical protein BJY04DRAFT_223043 [Aspergillus karnatakaensis]|uniref:FG-GAP repeat domain-containing protein n=1 Tax=Aspergillus karnatakaensis TaxID=1810916 RepID=UPI003CCE0262
MRSLTLLFTVGQLAIHLNPASATPYQGRVHETGSYFPAPADYGTWLMAHYPSNDWTSHAGLVSIQTSNTGTGSAKVQVADYGYQRLTDQKTNTGLPAENYGVWDLVDYDGDGTLDLIYIKNRDTASGKVEISIASGSSSFETVILQTESVLDSQVNGYWQLFDVDGDGKLDLVYIQNSDTASNKVEVHIASGASDFKSVTKSIETVFDIANDGRWQMANFDNDGTADLVYIQNINTSSGYVEINIASGASEYQSIVQSVASAYSTENSGVWQLIDWDKDGLLDLVYIKTQDTAGSVEVHLGWGGDN